MLAERIGDRRDLALLLIRVAVGAVFFFHGLAKFQGGLEGVAGFFGQIGIPAPQMFAPLVAAVETVGGLLLILGIFSRLSALLLAIVMVVAIVQVKLGVGLIAAPGSGMPGAELDLVLLAGLLAVLLQGPGRYAAELKLMGREAV